MKATCHRGSTRVSESQIPSQNAVCCRRKRSHATVLTAIFSRLARAELLSASDPLTRGRHLNTQAVTVSMFGKPLGHGELVIQGCEARAFNVDSIHWLPRQVRANGPKPRSLSATPFLTLITVLSIPSYLPLSLSLSVTLCDSISLSNHPLPIPIDMPLSLSLSLALSCSRTRSLSLLPHHGWIEVTFVSFRAAPLVRVKVQYPITITRYGLPDHCI